MPTNITDIPIPELKHELANFEAEIEICRARLLHCTNESDKAILEGKIDLKISIINTIHQELERRKALEKVQQP